MKFAHLSDCHIGGWREETLRQLSVAVFQKAVNSIIEENVDFVLIAGDLFNTAIPSVEAMEMVTGQMKRLNDHGIPVYLIPGSHDFSPSGKTLLNVLEKAGLCANVMRSDGEFTVDRNTGVKLFGVYGLKGGLEKEYYSTLNREKLEREDGVKIFLFHSLLDALKIPSFEQVPGEPMTMFPKGFAYYAGGHPHFVHSRHIEGYGMFAYPGPLFPNTMKELEDLGAGGFYIVETEPAISLRHVKIQLKEVRSVKVQAHDKSVREIQQELLEKLRGISFADAIVTIRIEGILREGKPSEIDLKAIREALSGAYEVLVNTYKLESKEFETLQTASGSLDEIEQGMIIEHVKTEKASFGDQKEDESITLIVSLLKTLSKEKLEGESNTDFEKRLWDDVCVLSGVRQPP